ncbi:hypothetical protein [Demequina sp.]|uniref:hypothetical protein n=1 Tax=Demequina sp. TaxID=2050685 RepID=UPI0025D2AE3D|nr:hypothetical protein [Demequina sp.]
MRRSHDRAPKARPPGRWAAVAILTLAGATAFWLANFAISLTPIAAEYRAGLSIAYLPMLLEALVGGLILGCGMSVVLIRFPSRVAGRDPFTKAMVLSAVVLVIVTVAVETPAKLSGGVSEPLRYLVIGTAFNAIRIGAMGVAVGSLARRRTTRAASAEPRPI